MAESLALSPKPSKTLSGNEGKIEGKKLAGTVGQFWIMYWLYKQLSTENLQS